jgi:hypothetical protein
MALTAHGPLLGSLAAVLLWCFLLQYVTEPRLEDPQRIALAHAFCRKGWARVSSGETDNDAILPKKNHPTILKTYTLWEASKKSADQAVQIKISFARHVG